MLYRLSYASKLRDCALSGANRLRIPSDDRDNFKSYHNGKLGATNLISALVPRETDRSELPCPEFSPHFDLVGAPTVRRPNNPRLGKVL